MRCETHVRALLKFRTCDMTLTPTIWLYDLCLKRKSLSIVGIVIDVRTFGNGHVFDDEHREVLGYYLCGSCHLCGSCLFILF